MSHFTRLPDLPDLPAHPGCGADTPDGPMCQAPSAVTITTCLDTDYAVIVWRCAEHADAAITQASRLADHAIVMVQPVDEAAVPDASVVPFARDRPAGRPHRPRQPD
jgi:hypothetical protein